MSKIAQVKPCTLVPEYIDAAELLVFDGTRPAAD
jgi:hypothetical protein